LHHAKLGSFCAGLP